MVIEDVCLQCHLPGVRQKQILSGKLSVAVFFQSVSVTPKHRNGIVFDIWPVKQGTGPAVLRFSVLTKVSASLSLFGLNGPALADILALCCFAPFGGGVFFVLLRI